MHADGTGRYLVRIRSLQEAGADMAQADEFGADSHPSQQLATPKECIFHGSFSSTKDFLVRLFSTSERPLDQLAVGQLPRVRGWLGRWGGRNPTKLGSLPNLWCHAIALTFCRAKTQDFALLALGFAADLCGYAQLAPGVAQPAGLPQSGLDLDKLHLTI